MNTNIPSEQERSESVWPLRRLGLRVQDMAQSLDYYRRLGFSLLRQEEDGSAGLGTGTQELLQLHPLAGGRPRPRGNAGLFHFALLVADEAELGSFLQSCLDRQIPLAGASDHLVSQALYLTDPEGNGIEVYADRPRTQWSYADGRLQMETLPLDAPNLLKQAQAFTGFSDKLRLGHMHLNVGDLERSMPFYQRLGMNLTTAYAGQANFLSWDGYHHHLGINIWAGRNARPVEPDMYGLDFFEIHRPELAPTTLQDADGVTVIVC